MRPHALGLALLLTACTNKLIPLDHGETTVRLYTGVAVEGTDPEASGELGVSTDYGIVFLGRGQRSGAIEFTVWFGDGPSLETGIVEPLGGGLYLTRAEIAVPTVPMTFAEPPAGTSVLVVGRTGRTVLEVPARIATDSRVDGLLLLANEGLGNLGPDQIGAGVYLIDGEAGTRELLGLLSGRMQLAEGPAGGGERDYYTVLGPRELWRLVAYPRDLERVRRRSDRGDVR